MNRTAEDIRLNWQNPVDGLANIQEHYVFSRVGDTGGLLGLFELREPFFVSYVPLADENGNLVNRARTMELAACKTADANLTMDFIGYVIHGNATENFRFGIDTPILKRYSFQALEEGLRNTLSSVTLPPLTESESFATELAISRILEYSTWPSVTLFANYLVPPQLITNVFSNFMENEITADEAVTQMENAITAWLMEEQLEIEEYVYIPEEIPDLPVRTLTVRNADSHTAVLQQAADAMNADWRARDIPYIFNLEIEDHSWLAMSAGHRERLKIELMAGQGPDMFLFDRHDQHAFANSGFLRDIYTLMDACPNTSRDEFFTQALEAFEINNSLYIFPISFGFEYIGINMNLPDYFINRFAEKSYVTLMELLEFYLELMDTHGDEFRLSLESGSNIVWEWDVFQATMGGFVDFNSRVSNLTDPRFAEAMNTINRVYADWDVTSTWMTSVGEPHFLRDRARESVFLIQSRGLNNFDAFFTAETPIFSHHIPIADEQGRLLLDRTGIGGQIWSAVCITTAGDGELAWEFTRHFIYAHTNPVGRAAVVPGHGTPATWGSRSFATPILRSLFKDHAQRSFENTYETMGRHMQTFVGFDSPENRARQFENAINRIAAYNEQPMALISPMIPFSLVSEHFEQFRLGLINAETAAQRMHNAVSLWLIE